MRYLWLLIAVVVPLHAGVIWDSSGTTDGWPWFNQANSYGGPSYASGSVSFAEDMILTGYEHYSNVYSLDPGFYRLRVWDQDPMTVAWPNLNLMLTEILTADSVTQVSGAPIFKVSFSFAPIQLRANEPYLFGLTTNSPSDDAGQWFLNGVSSVSNHGVVLIASDSQAGGGMGAWQMYQLDGTAGDVPEPATAWLSALALGALALRARRMRR